MYFWGYASAAFRESFVSVSCIVCKARSPGAHTTDVSFGHLTKALKFALSIIVQATKIATWSIPEAEVIVGENGTQVSFEEWAVPSDVEDNSTVVVALATMGVFASEGSDRWWGTISACPELPKEPPS